jgi:alkanesulfonate monooxygenase SsuD/methylene tetrahydromethanopterin reductase-like flavin-dependent oxidoreductase (luciferase family)
MRIAARFADEWNVWGEPDTLRHKIGVLERHCAELGRDPGEIRRSCQALLFHTDDEASAASLRERGIGMASLIGTSAQLVDVIGEYQEAGVDELIVPDFTLAPGAPKLEALDRFRDEVASAFR